jgi:uncharacterized protein
MARQLSSGISIEEESPQVRQIESGQTSIGAMLGIAQRGPFDSQLLTGPEQYKRLFGGHIQNGTLSHEVQQFFDNGGSALYVKRVVHYTDPSDASTKTSAAATLRLGSGAVAPSGGSVLGSVLAPFRVQDGQTLVASVDGAADATATFNGDAAAVQSADGPFALAHNQQLQVSIDGGATQTVAFLSSEFAAIATATPAEVAAVINAKLAGGRATVAGAKVVLASDKQGTQSGIHVTGDDANDALAFATDAQAGTGNVGDLAAVTLAEAKSVIEAALAGTTLSTQGGYARLTSNTTGGSSSVQVKPSSTARLAFGFDTAAHAGGTGASVDAVEVTGKTDGSYANDLLIEIEAPTSGRADEFNLTVLDDAGVVRETWPNLSVDPTSDNFAEIVVNDEDTGSPLIALSVLGELKPAIGVFGPLTGGDDGLSGIGDLDFLGNKAARTGLHGFNLDEDARVLGCPDRETPIMHIGMIQYAQVQKKMGIFPVLSSPLGLNIAQVRQYVNQNGLKGISEFGAFYYPNVKVLNPNKALYGADRTITISPTGGIMGLYGRVDSARAGGIYDAPAGTERGVLANVVGLENDYTQEESNRDLIYPERINPIRFVGGRPTLDGVVTLRGDSNFPSISERRGVIFIEQAIKAGTEFIRFRNNDLSLQNEVERTLQLFLDAQMRLKAFRSQQRASAYFIDVKSLNSAAVVFARQFIGRIGLATQKPAEFVVFRFSQDTRALEAELAAS